MSSSLILLSIKPQHAQAIYSGQKSMELRKNRPWKPLPWTILIYESAPVKAITGSMFIERVVDQSPHFVWENHGPKTAISQGEFMAYYLDCYRAVGWEVRYYRKYRTPIPLEECRVRVEGFHPPQSWRYLSDQEWNTITNKKYPSEYEQ